MLGREASQREALWHALSMSSSIGNMLAWDSRMSLATVHIAPVVEVVAIH